MKKNGIIAILLLAANLSFAQSYQELMNQAKTAEENNKLITALGMYYDAAHTSDAETEAEKRFTEIKTVLESGKPDLSEDEDIFTKNEKWIDLRKDFVRYFTNNCPWTFYFSSDFERVKLNTENKTADYKIYYTSRISKKYRLLEKILNKGSPEEAKAQVPLNGSGTEINVKELTNAKTWSKEWYDNLDEKIAKLNSESPYKYYLGQEYKYGSKEQQYFYSVVNKTDFSKKDPTLEDFLKVANDYEAYQWVNLSVPPMASVGLFITIGLYDGDTLLYEFPNVLLSGCSFGRTTEDKEYIEEDRKENCKSINISNIPQEIVNKIEKKTVQYKVTKSFIPCGFYTYTNDSEVMSMKMGKIGDLTWEHIPGSYADVSAKNLDRVFKINDEIEDDDNEILLLKNKHMNNMEFEKLTAGIKYKYRSKLRVYQTNAFGEITYLYRFGNRNYDKRDAQKIVSELGTQGWELLEDYDEDYFKSFKFNDSWSEEQEKQFLNTYWTKKEINNKKSKGERCLIFKKKY